MLVYLHTLSQTRGWTSLSSAVLNLPTSLQMKFCRQHVSSSSLTYVSPAMQAVKAAPSRSPLTDQPAPIQGVVVHSHGYCPLGADFATQCTFPQVQVASSSRSTYARLLC